MKNRTMTTRAKSPRRNSESGYTLLIALLLVATILLITAAAAPNLYIQGRRQRDEEMIWRGQQYTRAIGLYYKKYGHYPHTIDDLVKNDNQIRFLRQAYPDPMNTDDGSWRLIYLGPGGVLINSVMYTNIAQVGLPMGAMAPTGAPGGGQNPDANGLTPTGGTQSQTGAPATSGEQNIPGAAAPTGAQYGAAPPAQSGAAGFSSDDSERNMSDVIGGNLVGVGSKVKKPSIKIYNGGTTYYQWEFIWKPQQTLGGAAGAAAGAQTPGTPGTTTPPGSNSTAPSSSPAPNTPAPSPGM
jgi:type II secretory pathway pseudopilin PulG